MIVKKSQNELFHGSKISILHPTPHHHLGAYVAVCSRLPIYHLHVLFMVALCNRADHYIFMLLFVLVLLLLSFFSSPNLSSRRLDVYHTSAHGVVLV